MIQYIFHSYTSRETILADVIVYGSSHLQFAMKNNSVEFYSELSLLMTFVEDLLLLTSTSMLVGFYVGDNC